MKYLYLILSWIPLLLFGQTYRVEIPRTDIAQNEALVLSLVSEDGQITQMGNLPEINSFQIGGRSSSMQTQIINGQRSFRHEIQQQYQPTRQGQFAIPAFETTINGQRVRFPGATVRVGPPKQTPAYRDPFDVFRRPQVQPPAEEEYFDVADDAFFAITSDKKEVFQGEGFLMTIAFYLTRDNRVVKFGDKLQEQLEKILQEVKPANCWEEVINLKGSNTSEVIINGKPYRKITFYKAMYFPFNQNPIEVPSKGIEMVKFKLSNRRDVFGRQYGKRDYKYFYSRPLTVKVKPLPSHPLRDQVAVGQFELREQLASKACQTGTSLNYRFEVIGTGNVKAIVAPHRDTPEVTFDIYPPNTQTQVRTQGDRLISHKRFDYQLVANEPGTHSLDRYFSWVYFDPARERYDTLRSAEKIMVTGESKRNLAIASNGPMGFYDRLTRSDNDLFSYRRQPIDYLNIFLVGCLMLSMYFFVFKR